MDGLDPLLAVGTGEKGLESVSDLSHHTPMIDMQLTQLLPVLLQEGGGWI